MIVGEETAPTTGTRHLQCFMMSSRVQSWSTILDMLPIGTHVEITHSTTVANIAYCKKQESADEIKVYHEFGTPPQNQRQGRRTDIDEVIEWCDTFIDEKHRAPTQKEWALHMPKALVKWSSLSRVMEDRAEAKYPVKLVNPLTTTLRCWQRALYDGLSDNSAHDRYISFFSTKVVY